MAEGLGDDICCRVVELRQYTLKPGARDAMIALFDQQFVETQEAAGMRIIGQFRDLDDPDRFVWLRGFSGMPQRRDALTAFYDGPVWAAHREAARATMVDTDNALLLRPSREGSGFRLDLPRPPTNATALPGGCVIAAVHHVDRPESPKLIERAEQALARELWGAGATVLASLATETSENTYPSLPVRAGEEVFVWFAQTGDRAGSSDLLRAVSSVLPLDNARSPQLLRLAPTARSALR